MHNYENPWKVVKMIAAFLLVIYLVAWLVSCRKATPQPYRGWIGADSNYVAPDHAPDGFPKH